MRTLPPSHPAPAPTSDESHEAITRLSIQEQLQLAACQSGGTLEAQMTGAAIATVVSRVVQLSEEDQQALFACFKDLSTVETKADAEDTLQTILEILEPFSDACSVEPVEKVDAEHAEPSQHASWLQWISKRLRDKRKAAGLTQEQLAQKAGLTQSHLSRLEQGVHSPSSQTLERLAQAFGVDVGEFSLVD